MLKRWTKLNATRMDTRLKEMATLLEQARSELNSPDIDQETVEDYGVNSYQDLKDQILDRLREVRSMMQRWNNVKNAITVYALQRSTLPSVFESLPTPDLPQVPIPFDSIESIVGHENDFLLA
jgi:hypothetical protein